VPPVQHRAIKRRLELVRSRCDTGARLDADPVGMVHRFTDPLDQELVALVAASIAFGNVKTIRAKLEALLVRLGPRPAALADAPDEVFRRLDGWVHRVFRGEDVARLVVGARAVQRKSGSLGARFEAELRAHGALRPTLAAFCEAIRDAGAFPSRSSRRGPSHLLPNPAGSSGSKRLLLFLRWMIRPADGVDLGLWPNVPPSILLCPVDTHIHKLARNLGFTRRNDLSWQTAEEVTLALRLFDAEDPVKYDFSLCHMGMLQRCPSRKDAARCEGCGVKAVCRHWR
jgi:uncharacterized protein (TIGR02757 family)